MRLYRKGGPSLLDLGQAMIEEASGLAAQPPLPARLRRCLRAAGRPRGAPYPRHLPISRMKRMAAIFELPRFGALATAVVPARRALGCPVPSSWPYAVHPQPILLAVVVDVDVRQPDDLFFTTDLSLAPEEVASLYAGAGRSRTPSANTKQLLGGEDPQSWKGQGPERAAALSLWTYSAVWL